MLIGKLIQRTSKLPVLLSFMLPMNATTSGGIYSSQGVLVRNLWTLEKRKAGAHKYAWDGKDNEGNDAPAGSYELRICYSNMKAEWAGVIGNYSDELTGPGKYRQYDVIQTMAVDDDTLYMGYGWSERQSGKTFSNINEPGKRTEMMPITGSTGPHSQCSYYNCTDGNTTYWAGNDVNPNTNTGFIFGTDNSTKTQKIFSGGHEKTLIDGFVHISVGDEREGRYCGLAVQKNGIHIFSCRRGKDEIQVINKNTLEAVQTIPWDNPHAICVDVTDEHLWIASGTEGYAKYAIDEDGYIHGAPVISINNTGYVENADTDPTSGNVSIINLTHETIDTYDQTGTRLWSYGQTGGYKNETLVSNDRFFFDCRRLYRQDDTGAFIKYQNDGKFWIGDPGNMRVMRFKSPENGTDQQVEHLDTIGYITANYSVSVDKVDNTKVFCMCWEYNVNHSLPIDNGKNGSWSLYRNHAYKIQFPYPKEISNMCTFPNGKRYALFFSNSQLERELVQLANDEYPIPSIKFSGKKYGTKPVELHTDGSIRYLRNHGRDYENGLPAPVYWCKRELSSYDSEGWPVWKDEEIILAQFEQQNGGLTPTDKGCSLSISEGGYIPVGNSFSDGNGEPSYHQGGIKVGEDKYTYLTAKGTSSTHNGPFPSLLFFDNGNGMANRPFAGGPVWAHRDTHNRNYIGEFYRGSQTNMFGMYHEQGLPVLEFGEVGEFLRHGFPGMAGNAGSVATIEIDEDSSILYENDEQWQGGIPVWKISGYSTLNVIKVPFKAAFTSEEKNFLYEKPFSFIGSQQYTQSTLGHLIKYPDDNFIDGKAFVIEPGSVTYDIHDQKNVIVYHNMFTPPEGHYAKFSTNKKELSENYFFECKLSIGGWLNRGNDSFSMFGLSTEDEVTLVSIGHHWRENDGAALIINNQEIASMSFVLFKEKLQSAWPILRIENSGNIVKVMYANFPTFSFIVPGNVNKKVASFFTLFNNSGSEAKDRVFGIFEPKFGAL